MPGQMTRWGVYLWRLLVVASGIIMSWQLIVMLTGVPAFIVPAPIAVGQALISHSRLLAYHTLITGTEIVLGLIIGCTLGIVSATLLMFSARLRRFALPAMVVTQSLPVFALAPLLTLWFGYGMASKVMMAVLIIYFPVVAATFDGLRRTPTAMIDLARTFNAGTWAVLWHIRLPAALPSIGSGVRVATSVAPIGAIVGEWVGSSRGLGYLMLHANGRMQTDLMFAALLCLCLMALALYSSVNTLLERCLYWQKSDFSSALQLKATPLPHHTQQPIP